MTTTAAAAGGGGAAASLAADAFNVEGRLARIERLIESLVIGMKNIKDNGGDEDDSVTTHTTGDDV